MSQPNSQPEPLPRSVKILIAISILVIGFVITIDILHIISLL